MRPEIDFAGRQVHGSRETQDDYYGFCPLAAETAFNNDSAHDLA